MVVDFGYGDVEPALKTANEALHDAPFLLQGFGTLQMQIRFQDTDNHLQPFRWVELFLAVPAVAGSGDQQHIRIGGKIAGANDCLYGLASLLKL